MKLLIRLVAASALGVSTLVFVWTARSEASCAPASGYVVQFCVNAASGQPVATTKTGVRVEVSAGEFFYYAPETPLTANWDGDVSDQATATPAANEGRTATPAPRVAPLSRSYPRSFATYDALIEYASAVAAEQKALNESLSALAVREGAASAAGVAAFDPGVRGGLLSARTHLKDEMKLATLRSQLAADVASRQELLASGAVLDARGPWHIPLAGEVTQEFGPSRLRYEPPLLFGGAFYRHFHAGTDIAAPWGAPIYAPAAGTVVFAGVMGDGATVLVIAHDSGLVSMYAHLDRRMFPPPVKAGDTVQGGDRIGNVGVTGITTGPHLHWGVWRDGELIDPLSIIGDHKT